MWLPLDKITVIFIISWITSCTPVLEQPLLYATYPEKKLPCQCTAPFSPSSHTSSYGLFPRHYPAPHFSCWSRPSQKSPLPEPLLSICTFIFHLPRDRDALWASSCTSPPVKSNTSTDPLHLHVLSSGDTCSCLTALLLLSQPLLLGAAIAKSLSLCRWHVLSCQRGETKVLLQ